MSDQKPPGEILKRHFFGLRWPVLAALARQGLWRKLFNYLLAEIQMKLRVRGVVTMPYWLILDPNSGCDLRCPFCPTGKGKGTRERTVMKWDHFKRVMDELGPYLLHLEFSNWGEPLLNPRLFDMIRYAKSFGIEVHFSSHFNHFSEEAAEKMLDSGLDWLVVSIDGASQQTYERYRVGGDFNAVMTNLKTLVAAKKKRGAVRPMISWQFLVFRHNEHEIEMARAIAFVIGVDRFGASPAAIPLPDWIPVGAGASLYPDKKEGGAANETLNPEALHANERKKLPLCAWPWIGAAVNANGSLSPCCGIEDEAQDYGSVVKSTFREIWRGKDYREGRRFVATREDNGYANTCTKCTMIGTANMHIPDWWDWGSLVMGLTKKVSPLEESFRVRPFNG